MKLNDGADAGKKSLPEDGPDSGLPMPAAPQFEEPKTLLDRAIAKDVSLSTPARRRAAFLRHLARCRTVTEAAARTGIDRRTARRWYNQYPAFAARWVQAAETRRRQAIENVVLAADDAEMRQVYYRGRRIGQYLHRDRALGLYLLKQADAEAVRREKRRDTERNFEVRVQEEVARRVSSMPRLPRHGASRPDDEIAAVSNDL